ncbi:DUF4159 domain-containing protein [soil metagenome]
MRRIAWILVLCVLAAPAIAATPAAVDESVRKAIDNLYALKKDGTWETIDTPKTGPGMHDSTEGAQYGGLTAVATYALLSAGEKPNDPRLTKAIDFLRNAKMNGCYAISVRAQVWPLLPPSKDNQAAAKRDAALLVNSLKMKGEGKGTWDYYSDQSPEATADHSTTQFAILGLYACAEAGVEFPDKLWQFLEQTWRQHQMPDGGWAYRYQDPAAWGQPTLSMTAAGVASLFLLQDQLKRGSVACTGNAKDAVMDRGFAWIGREFPKDFRNPGNRAFVPGPGRPMYLLFVLQRLGIYSGYRYFNDVDWFKAGSDFLVDAQRPDGSWGAATWETSLGLLFMARGRSPIAFNKLNYTNSVAAKDLSGKDIPASWNQRPRDLANLCRWLTKQTERRLNWQIVDLGASPLDWLDAPILYVSGSDELKFSPEQIAKLKAYIEGGGMIVGNADCGNPKFANSFKKLGTALTGNEFRELPADHVMYAELFPRARWKQKIGLKGITNGARELLLLFADSDPARAWQLQNTSRRELFEAMCDEYAYSPGVDSGRTRGESPVVQSDPAIKADRTIAVARLKYAGNWDPEPGGWRRLAAIMHNQYKTDIDVQPIELGHGKLSAAATPVAHLTGTMETKLTDAARIELKAFVDVGGTLIVDATGGSTAFATAIENDLAATFIGNKFASVDDASPLLSTPNDIKVVKFRTFAQKSVGAGNTPRFKVIEVNQRAAVIFSALDLSVGLVGTNVDGITGYEPASAMNVMVNLLMNAKSAK